MTPLPPGERGGVRGGGYTTGDMIVLGINETHCATAAVLRDGRIMGCASEERFSRLKNERDIRAGPSTPSCRARDHAPDRSTWWRSRARARPPASGSTGCSTTRTTSGSTTACPGPRGAGPSRSGCASGAPSRAHRRLPGQVRHLPAASGSASSPSTWASPPTASCASTTIAATRPPPTTARASRGATRSSSPTTTRATASAPPRPPGGASGSPGTRPRRARPGSLGAFYSFVTLALGMKFGEHEYKVMGLAPYAPEPVRGARGGGAARSVRPRGRGPPLRWRERASATAPAAGHARPAFDWVAAGAQRLLEDMLVRWAG